MPNIQPVPGFPKYFVDEYGNVYSSHHKKMRMLHPRLTRRMRDKRRIINVSVNGKIQTIKVAMLVLTTFIGPRPKGMFACHGIKGNHVDSIDNLYWATPKQNTKDRQQNTFPACSFFKQE